MKFESDIFQAFNGESGDMGLWKVLGDLSQKTKAGRASMKFNQKLLDEAREAKNEVMVKKMLQLDHTVNALRTTCLDLGLAVGFVMGKYFELGNKTAIREFRAIEKICKKEFPFWPKRIELKEGD